MGLVFFGERSFNIMHSETVDLEQVRGFFERPAVTFEIDELTIERILKDKANPLNIILNNIEDGSIVLDVGTGSGLLAHLLIRTKKNVVIDGIEPDTFAYGKSNQLYRKSYNSTLEEFIENASKRLNSYDYIIFADVIEHLANPSAILLKTEKLLKKEGKILISTPNIAFASVRLSLLNGNFNYTDSGILERTHLRFFTQETLHKLFNHLNLSITKEYHSIRNPALMEIDISRFWNSPFLITHIDRDPLSRVYQFVFCLSFEKQKNQAQVSKIDDIHPPLFVYLFSNVIKRLAVKIVSLMFLQPLSK